MKQRILLIVAVLLIAMPAFATVNITVSAGTGVDANKVTVGYSCTAAEKVRAFALNLSLGSAGNSMVFADVNNIHDFITGESNSVRKGYGIFPGQFRNNIDPAGPNWIATYYTPIAPPNDVDSNSTGFGNRTAIAELGTLYVGEANAPGTSGTLFSIRVDPNSKTSDTITVTANTIRGGIVLEDGSTVAGNLPQSATISLAPADCLYVGRVFSGTGISTLTVTQAHIDRWVTLGKPNCWCCDAQKRGNAVYTGGSAQKTDLSDLAKMKNSAQWNQSLGSAGYNANPCCDTNLSGKIDLTDVARVKNTANWNQVTGPGPTCL